MHRTAHRPVSGWRAIAAIAVAALLTSAWTPAQPVPPNSAPPRKTSMRAWTATATGAADLIVQAAGYPDLSPARRLSGKLAKTRFVFDALTAHAARAQAGLLAGLRARGRQTQSLWISNQVWVRNATQADVRWLAGRLDVAAIDIDAPFIGVQAVPEKRSPPALARARRLNAQAIEWGVQRVRAPEMWALSQTGQGIVVADLDTGVRWDHAALKSKYRGWDGITATHDYNWYDAAGHSISAPQLMPFDDNGHGTHTTGTIVGDDGAGNQIGVAPGARWIGCRNMLLNTGSVARYTACFQFALAPTDVNGANPDPARGADITNNSWGCYPPGVEVGCEDPTALITVTQTLRDAGVMVVASAGNSGSGCATINSAPGNLDQAFSVGATTDSDSIAGFSSRGPSSLSGRLKPDVVAPGSGVRSAESNGSYSEKSGTSMAGPHVAGVAALLWGAAPELRGEVAETESILRASARPLASAQTCGGVAGSAHPNNVFGYGMIDARAAYSEALARRPAVVAQVVSQVQISEPVTLTIGVANAYSAIIVGSVGVTLSLPPSMTVLDAAGGVLSPDTLTWTLPALAPGVSRWLTVTLQAAETGAYQFAVRHTLETAGIGGGSNLTTMVSENFDNRLFLPLTHR